MPNVPAPGCASNSADSRSSPADFAQWLRRRLATGQLPPRPHISPGRSRVVLFPNRAPSGRGDRSAPGESRSTTGSLIGVTVLLVEDDFIVAFDMQTLLEEAGAIVVGPATTVAQARELLGKSTPTVALLDVNLNGEHVFPLVTDLQRREIPFLFATAYADNEGLFPDEARAAPRLAKPVLPSVLIGHLKKLLA